MTRPLSRSKKSSASPASAPPPAHSGRAARGATPPTRYAAAVCGDGRVLTISQMCGRRLIREIDPLSSQGRSLLAAGQVTLFYDDGRRVQTAPIDDVLGCMESDTRVRRDAYPHLSEWTSHHDRVLKSIVRMKRRLDPHH